MKGYNVEVTYSVGDFLYLTVLTGRHKGRMLMEPRENLPGAEAGDSFIILVDEDRVPFRKVTH
jgi:hypothetical protein